MSYHVDRLVYRVRTFEVHTVSSVTLNMISIAEVGYFSIKQTNIAWLYVNTSAYILNVDMYKYNYNIKISLPLLIIKSIYPNTDMVSDTCRT